MDSTHLHLLLNHFPILGSLMGFVLLLYGVWQKNDSIQKVSLAIIVVMALMAIPVFLTGEPAEESVENIPGVIESTIKAHEEAAEIAFWVMEISGVLALMALVLYKMQIPVAKTFVSITLIATLATFGLMARTGYLGGQIRHTEISGNVNSSNTIENASEKDDD